MRLVKNINDELLSLDDYYSKITIEWDDNVVLGVDEEIVMDLQASIELYLIDRYDLMSLRKFLKTYILPNQDNLLNEEKLELEKLFIYPQNYTMMLSSDDQIYYWDKLVKAEYIVREDRISDCKSIASFYLDRLSCGILFNDTKDMFRDYIDAELPHILFQLSDGAYPLLGIDFTTTGFSSKSYYNTQIQSEALFILTK